MRLKFSDIKNINYKLNIYFLCIETDDDASHIKVLPDITNTFYYISN